MSVSTILDEQLDDTDVAILRCPPQRIIAVSVHICAALKEELHNICVAMRSSRLQRLVITGVQVSTSSTQQLHGLEVPAPGSVIQGHVHYTLPVLDGLQQRRAMLVHAGCNYGADNSHVAEGSRA